MSYDACTTYTEIPVAMSPQELEVKTRQMLELEISCIMKYLETKTHDLLSRFSVPLLDGCL